jgi:hypothetical protein
VIGGAGVEPGTDGFWDAIPPEGGGVVVPEPTFFDSVLPVLLPVAGIGLGLLAVYGAGRLVASFEARRAGDGAASRDGQPSGSSQTSAVGRAVVLASGAAALLVGVLAGRLIAYNQSVGGLGGALGAAFLIFGTGVLVAVVGGTGLIALRLRRGHAGPAIQSLLAAGALLVVGAVGGNLTAAATGGLHREPVVQVSTASVQVQLAATKPAFVPRTGGEARCSSVPDGNAVAGVEALDLGELGNGTLRAAVFLSGADVGARIELWIDGADVPEDTIAPTWGGEARIDAPNGGLSGRASFDVESTAGAGKPGDPTAPPGPDGSAWPLRLAGELLWACDGWSMPPT